MNEDSELSSLLYAKTLLQAGIQSSLDGFPDQALTFLEDARRTFELQSMQDSSADLVVTRAWIQAVQPAI